MTDFGEIVNKEKLDNHVSVLLGLRYMVNGLQDYVTKQLHSKQTELKQKCALVHCKLNCSSIFGGSIKKWCDTCKYWKSELLNLHEQSHSPYPFRIKWNKINSISFPQSLEEIAKVFIKDFHAVRHSVLLDLGALMSLIRNATLFDISSRTIDEILHIRNNCCAHNYLVELHEAERNICLDVFVRFLKIPEIICTDSGKNALNRIETLQLSHGLPAHILQKPDGRRALEEIRNEHHNGNMDQNSIYSDEKLQERLDEIIKILNERRKYHFYLGPSPKAMKHGVIQLIFLICLTYWYLSSRPSKESLQGCLNMRFKNSWNIDSLFDFNYYVENLRSQSIISREWLYGKIDEELATSEKGVILVAEMGYGKSSIVSNIVCAQQTSNWYALRLKVLAYHFCRYDSISSTKAANYIRNLASAIVKRYPDLGYLILSDDFANELLYGMRCSEDPILCLEIVILNPLRGKLNNYQFVIIIDALDECDRGNKNDMLQLLLKQVNDFPPNIKFIFTSRDIEQVLSKFKDLNTIQLSNFNNENKNDISQYIRQISHLKESQIDLLTNVARGNFLHVKLYLQSCEKANNCDFKNVPASLEKIYQVNFERAFDAQSLLFKEMRPILEVLCTMTKPMPEEHIFDVAGISAQTRRKIENVIGNELAHFLIITDGNLSFLHKSISDFLTCKLRKRSSYFVCKENGHTLFAAYILKSFNIYKTDIVDVVHHVAMSRNDVLQRNLLQQVRGNTHVPLLSYLYKVVRDFNCYNTTDLFLKMIDIRLINDIDDRNISATFVAASFGNEYALMCLLDSGADPYFKVTFSYMKRPQAPTDLVHRCKFIYFCGYSLLHIASQNGHIQVVQMLVERHHDLLFTRNDLNLSAFELAAENGHIEIAAYLLNKSISFANGISLHHAAQNGHTDVVKLLLQNNVKDTCLPCYGSFYWIPNTHSRQQDNSGTSPYGNLFSEEKYSYDDWYLITCETALNAAVRNGHLKVVEILLTERTNSLNCTTFDGKSPIMTAVRYNQTTVLSHLLKFNNDLTAKCKHELHSTDHIYGLSKYEQSLLIQQSCSNGMSIIHLLVVHWNVDIFMLLYKNGLINFEDRDNDQSTPLHYAFCHSNYDVIQIAIVRKLNFNVRSNNGSTPYHSAAVCNAFALYIFMARDDEYKLTIPDEKDINNVSILQYGQRLHSYSSSLSLLEVAIKSKHDLYHTDIMGRNVLHYAATNGNFHSFASLTNRLPQVFLKLLQQKDDFGKTPVDELFSSMPQRKNMEPLKLPKSGDITHFLPYASSQQNTLDVLSPHEACILIVLLTERHLRNESAFQHFNITNYLILSIRKKRLYPLVFLKTIAEENFKDAVSNIPEIHNFLAEFEGPNIAEIILSRDNMIRCNGKVSPIHKIIQNDRGKYWTYVDKYTLGILLMDSSARDLDLCLDSEGYNVLQRAAMGGNIVAVKFLIKKGMDVTGLSRKGETLLDLAIVGTPVSENGMVPLYYYNSSRSFLLQYIWKTGNVTQSVIDNQQENCTVDFSKTSAYILKVLSDMSKSNLKTLKNQLCRSERDKFGYIQLSASKGFLQFLKICFRLFGVNILKCRDSNNITLYYLAHIYDQDHVIKWMDSLGVQMHLPSAEVEMLLLYNIVGNYGIHKRLHWSCQLQYSYRYMQFFSNVYKKCAIIDEHDVVMNNPRLLSFLQKHQLLSFMIRKFKQQIISSISILNFEYCVEHFDQICSDKALIYVLFMRIDKFFLKFSERDLRKIITFRHHDGIPIFQTLFNNRGVSPNHFKSQSFFGFFKFQYRYLELLSVRSDIHSLWIDRYLKKLDTDGVDLTTNVRAFKEQLSKEHFLIITDILMHFKLVNMIITN